jgi:hypothetical protein
VSAWLVPAGGFTALKRENPFTQKRQGMETKKPLRREAKGPWREMLKN